MGERSHEHTIEKRRILRIITWNCNMAFRKKADNILRFHPDVLIVPESESNNKIDFSKHSTQPTNHLWIGNNPNKGILISSYNNDIILSLSPLYNEEFRYVVPIEVSYKNCNFFLLAIWTQDTKRGYSGYVAQAYRALMFYQSQLNDKSMIIGDFNSNAIWDLMCKRGVNHTDTVNFLKSYEIESLYHIQQNVEQGEEKESTFYLSRQRDRSYHIDYIFSGQYWSKKLEKISIGKYDDWTEYSDHVPIIADFKS